MDELDLDLTAAEAQEEPADVKLATVYSVESGGVRITLDGETEAGAKLYQVNAMQRLAAGDRVKVDKISGSWLVEYAIGDPMARYPIPTGGNDGQLLAKDGSTAYAVKWVDAPHELPTGGANGQVLTKYGTANYSVQWADVPHELPSGGTNGQVLTKDGNTNYSVKWADVAHELPTGGANGQILAKYGTADYSVQWVDAPHGIPSGGTNNQVLTKDGNTNYSVKWATIAVSGLANGNYTFSLSNTGNLTGDSTARNVTLGSQTIPIGGAFLNGNIWLGTSSYQSTIGFFGTTPQTRKTVSTSGADGGLSALITALKGYGLIS